MICAGSSARKRYMEIEKPCSSGLAQHAFSSRGLASCKARQSQILRMLLMSHAACCLDPTQKSVQREHWTSRTCQRRIILPKLGIITSWHVWCFLRVPLSDQMALWKSQSFTAHQHIYQQHRHDLYLLQVYLALSALSHIIH